MKALRTLVATLMLVFGQAEFAPAFADAGLDDAFRGEAIGRGRFRSSLIGLDRGFIVRTLGRKSGDVFVLDQLFRFDDGSMDRRTWNFRKVGPKSYVGTRRDVVGLAKVNVDNDVIRMSYDIDMRKKNGGKLRLHFEDTVSRLGRGGLLNRAVIYTFGIPVGSVETQLVRQ